MRYTFIDYICDDSYKNKNPQWFYKFGWKRVYSKLNGLYWFQHKKYPNNFFTYTEMFNKHFITNPPKKK